MPRKVSYSICIHKIPNGGMKWQASDHSVSTSSARPTCPYHSNLLEQWFSSWGFGTLGARVTFHRGHISDTLHIRYLHYDLWQEQNYSYEVAMTSFCGWGHHNSRSCVTGSALGWVRTPCYRRINKGLILFESYWNTIFSRYTISNQMF